MFCQEIAEHKAQCRSLVFLDESGFAHDMPRTHGYSLKGQRCFGTHDWGAKGRTNVIGALLGGILLTVSLFQTTINTGIFNAWVFQALIPKLPPKSVVVMDNAAFHKGVDMVKALESAGHTLLYLPPYSPDLNPIEKKWAEMKAKRREKQCAMEDLFKDENI
jgi:transposase